MARPKLFKKRTKPEPGSVSYSQCGEDLVCDFLLQHILGIKEPYYLDIGAHSPINRNNTYLFYARGLSGVLVEPNPDACLKLRKVRPRDKVVTAGVSDHSGSAAYYRMDADTLNTFSAADKQRYIEQGHKLVSEETIELLSAPELLSKHCGRCPDFVSIDVEGLEMPILQSWDFSAVRPSVFCIETIEYTLDATGRKRLEVIKYVLDKGYRVYADTYINTVFFDGALWPGSGILG